MTRNGAPGQPGLDEAARLNGWKEISAFLGKGVRTAQRWERLFEMPVHRLGYKGGEIVFAYRDELSRWLETVQFDRTSEETSEGPPPQDEVRQVIPPSSGAPDEALSAAQRRFRLGALALAVVGVSVVASAVLGLRGVTSPSVRARDRAARQPSTWKVTGNRLQTFDAAGQFLWEHRFNFQLNTPGSDPYGRDPVHVLLHDIENDGTVETLLTGVAKTRTDRQLYCFNGDGSLRFVDRADGSVTFGEAVYSPPWLGYRLFVTASTQGLPKVWSAAIHGLWFPTRLRRLKPDGQLLSEYWSNGYIEFVNEGSWRGRRVLFVGGTNNENRGASLAVFDADRVTGSAPAADPKYVCRTCPPGGPEVFLVFPRSCVERGSDDQGFVYEAWPEGGKWLRVLVRRPFIFPQPDSTLVIADTIYTLDDQYRLVGVEFTTPFRDLHARLHALGVIDHPLGADDERELAQVNRWNGTAFEMVERVR